MKILQVNSRDIINIRHKMLRNEFPKSECIFAGDDNEQTFHLAGLNTNNEIVSAASFYYENNPNLKDEHQYRLRGMATIDEFQRKGYASALISSALPIAKQNMCSLIWCHARDSALEFYKKRGFKSHGKHFEIPKIGKHLLMYKYIN